MQQLVQKGIYKQSVPNEDAVTFFLKTIESWEYLTGINCCFHDYTGDIAQTIGSQRLHHCNAYCSMIKMHSDSFLEHCMNCDMGLVQSRIVDDTGPFLKKCHANITEIIVPLFRKSMLSGVMFIGPFEISDDLKYDNILRQNSKQERYRFAEPTRHTLPTFNNSKLQAIQQVSVFFSRQLEGILEKSLLPDIAMGKSYQERIQHFLVTNINKRSIRLRDIARYLCISESRVSQLLRTEFGKSFPALVTEYRIKRARYLLTHTYFTITEIARLAGFNDQAYFHRIFHRWVKTTPRQYRMDTKADQHKGLMNV